MAVFRASHVPQHHHHRSQLLPSSFPQNHYHPTKSTPLSSGSTPAKLSAIGVDTTSQPWTQAELVEEAWKQYQAFMGNLDIGSVNPAASYATFEQGAQAWTYYGDRVFT